VVEKCSRGMDRNVPDNELLARLVKLYLGSNSWYTRQQILSIFVCDHPKSELLTLIPGVTKWRIHHFTVVCSVAWPLYGSEARVDLVLIQTSLLLSCKCT